MNLKRDLLNLGILLLREAKDVSAPISFPSGPNSAAADLFIRGV